MNIAFEKLEKINSSTKRLSNSIKIKYPEDDSSEYSIDEEVILFLSEMGDINSFYHGISNLYFFLYYYYQYNETCKIIIPYLNDNHFYLQFIKIFLPSNKIILLDYDKTYKFRNIKIYDNIFNSFSEKDRNNDSIILDYINKILKEKIKLKEYNKYDKIFIYRSIKSCMVEYNRIFHNYDDIVKSVKNKIKDIYIFKPEEHTLEEQIFLMMNCSLLVTDWGSSLANNLWMKNHSKCLCIIHPWMAYFGKNQENSNYIETAKHLKINFKCCYCDTFYKKRKASETFMRREYTKKGWNGKLDRKYKYIVNLNNLSKIIDDGVKNP